MNGRAAALLQKRLVGRGTEADACFCRLDGTRIRDFIVLSDRQGQGGAIHDANNRDGKIGGLQRGSDRLRIIVERET